MSNLVLEVDQTQIVYGGTPAASLTFEGCETQTLQIAAAPAASLAVITQRPTLVATVEQGPPGPPGARGERGETGLQGPPGPQGISGLESGYAVDGGNF